MSECDPDRAGDMSIVVQGGLTAHNLFETANNVRHWRILFPAAQIILALSGTDILEPEAAGQLIGARLAPTFRFSSQMQAALTIIRQNCDVLALAQEAVPLPPIKSDTQRPNNINLQIAAAQMGLAHANGRYVLRVRSDLVFLDREFLNQYAVGVDMPTGDTKILTQRVLISWIYTLNPFAEERLPLHFSDWFHFGLRKDVTRLWRVPEMSLRDAVFYRTHPYPPHSNAAERLFNTRLAVEQHVLAHGLGRDEAGLHMRYHNDPDFAVASMRLLIDNFVLCDMVAARCLFPKYSAEFHNHRKLVACVTPADWRALAGMRHVDPRIILSDKIQRAHEPRYHEFRQGFPRRILVSQIATEVGTVMDEAIIAHGNGVVARGPRMCLPPGGYLVRVHIGLIEGNGRLWTTVTVDDKATIVGDASINATAWPTDLTVPFEIFGSSADDVEVLCRSEGLDAVTILGLSIDKVKREPNDRPFPRFDTLGLVQKARRCARINIAPGRYVAALDLPPPVGKTTIELRVTTEDGAATIATRSIRGDDGKDYDCQIDFDVTDANIQSLDVSCEGEELPSEIGLVIAQRAWNEAAGMFPRFYDANSLRVGNGRICEHRISSNGQDGVLCFGPYANLRGAPYVARVHFGGGWPKSLIISITGENGTRRIASRTFHSPQMREQAILVPFEISPEGMAGVEVVCSTRQPSTMFVTGVTLDKDMRGADPVFA